MPSHFFFHGTDLFFTTDILIPNCSIFLSIISAAAFNFKVCNINGSIASVKTSTLDHLIKWCACNLSFVSQVMGLLVGLIKVVSYKKTNVKWHGACISVQCIF